MSYALLTEKTHQGKNSNYRRRHQGKPSVSRGRRWGKYNRHYDGASDVSMFKNGAITGAFSRLFNDELHRAQQRNGTWDPVTNERIEGLHPDVQGPATNFVNEVESELGIQLRVTQGTRTIAEQDALYAQGRTAPGQIVTNARGGESYHNYGLAIDVVEIRNGQAIWNTNWQGIGNIGIRNGFEWGGNWTTIPDRPHFHMNFGLSIGDLQGGARP